MKILQPVLLIFATIFSIKASAVESIRVAKMFSGEELGTSVYTSLCQNSYGFMWIGTDNGLFRFDGSHYYPYRHVDGDSTSISDNRIFHILRDCTGKIWIATANGLNLYDESSNSFIRISIPNFGDYGYIMSITSDNNDNVYFIVSGVGIYCAKVNDNDSIIVKRMVLSENLKDTNCILAKQDGTIYAGLRDGSVYSQISAGKWERIALLPSSVNGLSMERNGSLIACTLSELYRINTANKSSNKLIFDTGKRINMLSRTDKGKIYVATSGAGLCEITENSDIVTRCSSLYSPFVNMAESKLGSVYVADDQTLWIGCDYVGILMLKGNSNPFLYRQISSILSDFDIPLSVMAIWKDNMVIGNYEGMLAVVSKEGKVKRCLSVPGGKSVMSIFVTKNDKALIGILEDGVWEFDLKSGDFSKKVNIPGKYVNIVTCETEDGILYIGVDGRGLLRFNPHTKEKKWVSIDSDGKDLISPFITTIKQQGERLWIGQYGGFSCFNTVTGKFEDIDQMPFVIGATYSVTPENENSILIGTSHGLIRYNPINKKIKKFTTIDGLADSDVRSIVIDSEGGKWIGTMKGISYQYPNDDRFISFRGGHGIVENSFESVGYSKEADKVYASGRMGITSFSPNIITQPKNPSTLKISAIYLNGNEITTSSERNGTKVIDGTWSAPVSLNLPYNENSLSLRLSTLDFNDISDIRYLWRFSGDKNWTELSEGSDMVHLPSLSPGKYLLEYMAKDGGVASSVSTLKIFVAHPWYFNWIAKTIYVLLILLLVALIIILIKKKHIERLNEKKMDFFVDLSHDMRSPLTLIINPLESLLKEQLNADMRSRIRMIYRNAHRILNLVNQLMDIKKIDFGRKRLECSKTDISCFVKEIVELFQSHADEKNIQLSFLSEFYREEVWIDRSVLDRVLVNLISNALKYTPENGKIDVILTRKDDCKVGKSIEIKVMDTGIGVGNDSLSSLFDRYIRLERGERHSDDGFGIGLDICKRFIELHHGHIRCENRKDGVDGSVFIILLPLDEAIYESKELIYEKDESEREADRESLMPLAIPFESNELENYKKRKSVNAVFTILIVEDDEELREYLSSQMNNYYKVYTASDGVEGYKLAQEKKPDIVISDVVMPNSDGLQLLRQLKFNVSTSHIPVIILSSSNDLPDRMAGWMRGAEVYLGKPFDISELLAIVDSLIEGRMKLKGVFSGAVEANMNFDSSLPDIKGNDEILLDRVMKILNDRIDEEDMNVDRLAKEVGVSRSQLYRRMKENLGMNPSEFIRNIRLKRACELLKNQDLDITQIAYALGFSSQSQFSTSFKRFMGYTPTEYRLKCIKELDSEKQ